MNAFLSNPWFWLIVVILILEWMWFSKERKSYTFSFIKGLLYMVTHTVSEVLSDEALEKFCGTIIVLSIMPLLIFILYGINCAFSDINTMEKIIICAISVLLGIPIVLFYHLINRKYIVRK